MDPLRCILNSETSAQNCSYLKTVFTLLTPKSGYHLISPYNITPESHIQVMKIKKKITNLIAKQILLIRTLGKV